MEPLLEVDPMPAPPAGTAGGAANGRAGGADSGADAPLVPVHLHPYRDFARMRCVYPVCLHRDEGAPRMDPLAALLDAAAGAVSAETDDAEQLRRALLKVERAVREAVRTEAPLSAAWDAAVAPVLDDTRSDRRQRLAALLEQARQALPEEATVLALAPAVAVRLLKEVADEQCRRLAGGMAGELQELVYRVEQLLALDDRARRPGPAAIGAAIATRGDGEVDTQALASLMGKVAAQNPLPERRRERLVRALGRIEGLRHVMSGELPEAGLWANEVTATVGAARARAEKRLAVLTDFFIAVHTAVLEVDNRYREEQHDAFFGRYVPAPSERAVCPPVLLHLEAGMAAPAERAELLDLLATDLPVKALLTVDRLVEDLSLRGTPWPASFAVMATALHHAYVAQTAASEVERLWAALGDGLAFSGPALFSVFTGEGVDAPHLHPFLRAAAAVESRAFPVFEYAPARSPEPGERLSLDGNPQPERAWRFEATAVGAGEAAAEELPFTVAEFLFCDGRLAAHFELLPDGREVEAMIPLDAYLALPSAERRGRVPFILAAGGDGGPVRLLVGTAVVEAARRVATAWRGLQEAAGVASVHARRALAEERERLAAEKQQALDELRAAHEAALAQRTGQVAERVVSNLAARLLNLAATPTEAPALHAVPAPPPAAPSPTPAAAPAEPPAAASAAEPPAAEDDDEPLALDEPYIETPRCTTCNECTNINGRMFAYDGNKQAYVADLSAGTYREMVLAAEKCPVDIIHPGKPWNPDEPGLDELVKRAEPFL